MVGPPCRKRAPALLGRPPGSSRSESPELRLIAAKRDCHGPGRSNVARKIDGNSLVACTIVAYLDAGERDGPVNYGKIAFSRGTPASPGARSFYITEPFYRNCRISPLPRTSKPLVVPLVKPGVADGTFEIFACKSLYPFYCLLRGSPTEQELSKRFQGIFGVSFYFPLVQSLLEA